MHERAAANVIDKNRHSNSIRWRSAFKNIVVRLGRKFNLRYEKHPRMQRVIRARDRLYFFFPLFFSPLKCRAEKGNVERERQRQSMLLSPFKTGQKCDYWRVLSNLLSDRDVADCTCFCTTALDNPNDITPREPDDYASSNGTRDREPR